MLTTTYLHSGWEFAEEGWGGKASIGHSTLGWLPAQIPGHVHLDLVANGIIADPFQQMNELGCQWVDERNWRYRTRFNFVPDAERPRRVLCFEGLDTICEIFLNGESIGRSDNMFVKVEFDVSEALREGENLLEVQFLSAVVEGRKRREAYFASEGLALDVRNFDERAFVRKAQYTYGWDWGPRLVSCGIWRPVFLIEFRSRITDVHVLQLWNEDGSVEVEVSAEFEGEGGLTVVSVDGAEQLENGRWLAKEPELWGIHQGSFYDCDVRLTRGACLLDRRVQKFGLRRLELLREPDGFGESFEFRLNGERLWIRGANWIPNHSFPSQVNTYNYYEQLQRAKDMGINMLRIWGGGLYETDEFYQICGQMGILVWQDFPFACSYYPEDEEFQQAVAFEALENVKRLRNHPCLAIWCGNNENQMMWNSKWGGAAHAPPRHYGLALYEELLPGILAEADPGRPYVESSPIWGSTQDAGVDPNNGGFGDQHYWDVWHGRGDWRYYSDSRARFSSEFGFASSCSAQTWKRAGVKPSASPESNAVRWHDKTGKDWKTFAGLVELHYPESRTLDDWIYYSQLNQRDALRFGIEHYRRSGFCRGTLIWQFNDCWPVESWALVDFDENLKAAAYELKRLHEDVLFSIVRSEDRVVLWGINDGTSAVETRASLYVSELRTGTRLRKEIHDVSLAPGERKELMGLSIHGLALPDLMLVGGAGVHQTWQLAVEPKSVRLPPPVKLTVSRCDFSIKADAPIIDLRLTENGSAKPFRENFHTLDHAGVFNINAAWPVKTLEARSLAGTHEVEWVNGPLI